MPAARTISKRYGALDLNWQKENLDEILTFFLTAFLTFALYTEVIKGGTHDGLYFANEQPVKKV